MKTRPTLIVSVLAGLLLAAAPARAQYMYLDSNGNGVHDAGDAMSANGSPTTVDVYLNTNHNRDGSLASCDTGDGNLTINTYLFSLASTGGNVTFSNFINRQPTFNTSLGELNPGNNTYKNGLGNPIFLQPGLYRLATLTVTGTTGSPILNIVDRIAGSLDITMFGTQCSGNDFDNTYKLIGPAGGLDWTDVDGLSPAACDNCPPVLTPIANMTVDEGAIATQGLTAFDADAKPLFFQKVTGPLYMTVATLNPGTGSATGQITLSPDFADAAVGVPASVRATDGILSDVKGFAITVNNVNRPPVSNPGGPYSGFVLVPVAFNGTASSDPDGSGLTYAWNFGDLVSAVGPSPLHAYTSPGTYAVSLTVSDGLLQDGASTSATISAVASARAFTTRNNRLIRLGSGKAIWSIQLEPIAQSYSNTDVDVSSIRMKSVGTGSVSEISAISGKGSTIGDTDGNGVAELTVSFRKVDLQALFANLNGNVSVPVTFEGNLFSGGVFHAQTNVGVDASGGGPTAAAYPNPFHPSGHVSIFVPTDGHLQVRVFDASGRLVRTLQETTTVPRGYRDIAMDGSDDHGSPLASGVYFLRIETASGELTTRFAIVR